MAGNTRCLQITPNHPDLLVGTTSHQHRVVFRWHKAISAGASLDSRKHTCRPVGQAGALGRSQLTGPPGAPTSDLSFISTVPSPPEPTRLLKYESAAFSQLPIPWAEALMSGAVAKERHGRRNGFGEAADWPTYLWTMAMGIVMFLCKTHPPNGPSDAPNGSASISGLLSPSRALLHPQVLPPIHTTHTLMLASSGT